MLKMFPIGLDAFPTPKRFQQTHCSCIGQHFVAVLTVPFNTPAFCEKHLKDLQGDCSNQAPIHPNFHSVNTKH
jgi:hypothetical protein